MVAVEFVTLKGLCSKAAEHAEAIGWYNFTVLPQKLCCRARDNFAVSRMLGGFREGDCNRELAGSIVVVVVVESRVATVVNIVNAAVVIVGGGRWSVGIAARGGGGCGCGWGGGGGG